VHIILMSPLDRKESDELFLLFRSDGAAVPLEVNDDMMYALMGAGWEPTTEPTEVPFRDENGNRLAYYGLPQNQQDIVDVVEDLVTNSLLITPSRSGTRQQEHVGEGPEEEISIVPTLDTDYTALLKSSWTKFTSDEEEWSNRWGDSGASDVGNVGQAHNCRTNLFMSGIRRYPSRTERSNLSAKHKKWFDVR